jgi:hypothetical protein
MTASWLDQFPADRRSTVANWFHFAVREGARTPAAVVIAVQETVRRRLTGESDPARRAHLATVAHALQQDGALAYAAEVITYEQLPYAERQRVKAERGKPYMVEAMRGKPPTEKQLALLRSKGVSSMPEDRAEASQMIDRLLQGGVD